MTTSVMINELANVPHRDGQIVLHAMRNDFEVQIKRANNSYRIYAFVRLPGGGEYTRLAAERSTPQQARDLAARAWAEGKDFDTIIG